MRLFMILPTAFRQLSFRITLYRYFLRDGLAFVPAAQRQDIDAIRVLCRFLFAQKKSPPLYDARTEIECHMPPP